MTLPRFFTTQLAVGKTALDPTEAQHASNSLRMSVGDQAVLFDGQNHEALATLVELTRKSITFEVSEVKRHSRELETQLEVVVALPKGDRQKSLIESLVQLGVHQLTPLQSARSVAKANDKSLDRLRRWVIESSKQCGRNQLMQIATSHSIAELNTSSELTSPLQLFAHPYEIQTVSPPVLLAKLISEQFREKASRPSQVRILIGPEGGLTDEECEHLIASSWKQFGLGPRILRVETAAVSAVAQLAAYSEGATNQKEDPQGEP